jgi:PAS domain S-box-containing protein
MNNPPIPSNEKNRLQALYNYDILDSLSEIEFDRITKLASLICDVPISLISFIDKERQWLKSNVGLDVPETKRSSSYCQFAIMDNVVFEVQDATKDERFENNELFTEKSKFRFYAGFPLIDEKGFALGTLCVIDQKPKLLNENQKKSLEILAQEVMQLIVERKNKAELQNFEKLFNLSNDMISIAGFDGFFKKVNPAFTNILGWDEKYLLKTPYLELIHPDDLEFTRSEFQKLTKLSQNSINFFHRLKTKNNEYKTIQWVNTRNIQNKDIYAIGRDVTEIKLKEQQLAYSEHQLKVFIESSLAFLYTIDFNGNFISGNKAFFDQTGFTKEELNTQGIRAIMSRDASEERIRNFFVNVKKLGSVKDEAIIQHKNGNLMRWTYIGSYVKNPTDEEYIIINAIDTTQRFELETDLKSTKERLELLSNQLQKQNDKLLNFAHITSHNLRAPVSNLNTLIYFHKESKDQQDRDLLFTKIETVNQHLSTTLNDLIESLKIQEDFEIEKENISLNDTLNKAKEILVAQIISSKAIVTSNFKAFDIISYPKNYLDSIILNLFTNAIKYASPDRIPEIHFETKIIDEQFILFVSDNGLGINLKRNAHKMFGFNKTFHRHPDAKGVGLFIIKTQIEALGGEISVESEVEKGSAFKIIFNKSNNE